MEIAVEEFASQLEPQSARGRYGRIHDEIRTRICMLDYPPKMRLDKRQATGRSGN